MDHVEGRDGELAGVDTDGRVWSLAAGRWTQRGSLPGQPQAFTAANPSQFLAATDAGVYSSSDGGRAWKLLASSDG